MTKPRVIVIGAGTTTARVSSVLADLVFLDGVQIGELSKGLDPRVLGSGPRGVDTYPLRLSEISMCKTVRMDAPITFAEWSDWFRPEKLKMLKQYNKAKKIKRQRTGQRRK